VEYPESVLKEGKTISENDMEITDDTIPNLFIIAMLSIAFLIFKQRVGTRFNAFFHTFIVSANLSNR